MSAETSSSRPVRGSVSSRRQVPSAAIRRASGAVTGPTPASSPGSSSSPSRVEAATTTPIWGRRPCRVGSGAPVSVTARASPRAPMSASTSERIWSRVRSSIPRGPRAASAQPVSHSQNPSISSSEAGHCSTDPLSPSAPAGHPAGGGLGQPAGLRRGRVGGDHRPGQTRLQVRQRLAGARPSTRASTAAAAASSRGATAAMIAVALARSIRPPASASRVPGSRARSPARSTRSSAAGAETPNAAASSRPARSCAGQQPVDPGHPGQRADPAPARGPGGQLRGRRDLPAGRPRGQPGRRRRPRPPPPRPPPPAAGQVDRRQRRRHRRAVQIPGRHLRPRHPQHAQRLSHRIGILRPAAPDGSGGPSTDPRAGPRPAPRPGSAPRPAPADPPAGPASR